MSKLIKFKKKQQGQLYYILSLKWSKINDGIFTWWKDNCDGYCKRLDWAGLYKKSDVESKPDYNVNSKISVHTKFIVGHSRGANKLLKQFNPKKFPDMRGVILFDPIDAFFK